MEKGKILVESGEGHRIAKLLRCKNRWPSRLVIVKKRGAVFGMNHENHTIFLYA